MFSQVAMLLANHSLESLRVIIIAAINIQKRHHRSSNPFVLFP
jgi:hypothetical protein